MSEPDIWEWLMACRTCGKPHEWRWRCLHWSHENQHDPRSSDISHYCTGGTWSDPRDGHSDNRRVNRAQVERLRAEYEAIYK